MNEGIEIEEEIQKRMESVIEENEPKMQSLVLSDFQRVFWDQQVG